MSRIKHIIIKEFRQIFRTRVMLGMMFFMPVFQLIILVNAATFEFKNLKVFVIDNDNSSFSRNIISKFQGSGYFKIVGSSFTSLDGEHALKASKADFYLNIPNKFERNLIAENKASVNLVFNAIDGVKAGMASFYAASVISDFNAEIRTKYSSFSTLSYNMSQIKNINVEYSHWYNPDLNYYTFMAPGILVMLLSLVGLFMGGLNVVREKEIGTIEQLNVTPIKKHEFIIGKLTPFWIIGLIELTMGLLITKFLYSVPIIGSLGLLYVFAAIYLLVVLGIGFFISTITETQQQAMFITWFFTVIFVLLSGLFTAIENMPEWARFLTYFNPLRYFMEAIRMIMLKGAGFKDIQVHIGILIVYALVVNFLAAYNYKKTG